MLGVAPQTRVDSFNTVDLFFAYDLGGVLKNSMLTVNIDNVFDQDPPYLNSSTGYTNGFSLGRLVSFGVRTKF
jgi:iron complex outermembrane receptor protein